MRLSAPVRWTASLAALAAAAAPPGVIAAWSAEARPALEIKVGSAGAMSHIELHWGGATRFAAERSGQTLTLHFPRDADPDLSLLRVDPPRFLQTAEARHNNGRLDLVLTLGPGADARTGTADGAIFVNLFAADPAKPAPAPPKIARPDPRPADGVVHLKGQINAGGILLQFPWRAPLGAAAFRRGEAIWLVFDTPVKLDLSHAPPSTPIFKSIAAVNGPDFSAIRVVSPGGAAVKAWAEGATWSLSIGPSQAANPEDIKTGRDQAAPLPTLEAGMAGATRAIWLDDPAVGDRIGVVTALAPAKGIGARRAFVDLAFLPSVQGLAFEPLASDLAVDFDTDWVRFSRPHGLTLSSVTALAERAAPALPLPQPASMPALIEFADWSQTGPGGFLARYGQLQTLAAEEIGREEGGDKQVGVMARMALARFLAGNQLSFEAIGVLNMTAKAHPEMLGDAEFRGLRGAVRVLAGRYKEAENDFSVPILAAEPSSSLWRGYIAAKQGDWKAAKEGFTHGSNALYPFPALWRARFARAYAESEVGLGELDVAATEIAASLGQTNDPMEQLATRLIQAKLFEAQGYPRRALEMYDAVARAPYDGLSAPAVLHATQIRLALGEIKPDKAADIFGGLRYRWRGDSTEIEAIRNLGHLYLSQGRYREALEAMRAIGSLPPDTPDAVQLQAELSQAFKALFLDGAADGMQPVQALALFYDFKELTPIGADGDLMVRKLVKRLIDVDLLDQAAELLKYQVDNRLDGAAKAEVATDLATLYLMDRKPEAAIDALNGSRTTVLPTALAMQRRLVEARAWLALNQTDHALELVGKDTSVDADDIRADVAWRARQWPTAGALLEKQLGERWKAAGPLSAEEEARLLRAGVAYSLANDEAGLARLRAHYQGMVDSAHSPAALRVALAGTDGAGVSAGDFAKIAASDDTFSGWVIKMKQHFKDAPASGGKTLASADTAARG